MERNASIHPLGRVAEVSEVNQFGNHSKFICPKLLEVVVAVWVYMLE